MQRFCVHSLFKSWKWQTMLVFKGSFIWKSSSRKSLAILSAINVSLLQHRGPPAFAIASSVRAVAKLESCHSFSDSQWVCVIMLINVPTAMAAPQVPWVQQKPPRIISERRFISVRNSSFLSSWWVKLRYAVVSAAGIKKWCSGHV